MRSAMERMAEDEWTPGDGVGGVGGVAVFRTDEGQVDAQGRSDYFLDSATAVHYFAEADAVDEDTSALRKEYEDNKLRALNKAGHGLHLRPGPFADYTRSKKVASLLLELGYVDPVVPQSMYIFKQARGGGEVTSHQDSTFLHTEPRQTCVGLWLALDDATLENGCLWVRPGSHREGLRRRFVRNPAHFGDSLAYCDRNVVECDDDDDRGDRAEPQMIFRAANDDDADRWVVPWEGSLPENSLPAPDCTGLRAAGFVPMPCEAGDLLAFAGTLDHLSLPNHSSGARHTFQLHCIEGEGAGVAWSRENWLQYPPGVSFMRLGELTLVIVFESLSSVF
ncbi:hypothetical protein ACHAW5_008272 [Stephanodiscus triporus]|uniref:Fe2OG dioxygenase domain-containing protein n=1 Tax=Stephanodiscus triporus TaxID=2934178 RepID=A0ABD3MYT7_9STRA